MMNKSNRSSAHPRTEAISAVATCPGVTSTRAKETLASFTSMSPHEIAHQNESTTVLVLAGKSGAPILEHALLKPANIKTPVVPPFADYAQIRPAPQNLATTFYQTEPHDAKCGEAHFC